MRRHGEDDEKWTLMTAAKLDPIDLKILDAIQRDGRITKLALADKVGLSPTPCWMRLRKLEKAGIVSGYHAKIAMRVVATVTTVLMEVTLASHRQADFDRFERVIRDIPEIVACWSVGGGVDYVEGNGARYRRLSAAGRRIARARDRHRPLLHLHRDQDGEGGDHFARGRPAAGIGLGSERLSAGTAQ